MTSRFLSLAVLACLSLVGPGLSNSQAASGVRASRGQITLPTYPWQAVKHPYFRGTDRVNIYPYPMLDFLSRDKVDRTYQTVVLENEYLRVTFLPELGGKVHEVIDKTTGQPMFYVNHVIKPALIGQCGAWTSGGIEWNTGPQGHTVGCMQPAAVEILPRAPDGSVSVAIGETERIYRTKWTVVVTLRPGRSFIEERIRIYNPTETIRPYYFWNCTAVPNTKGFRFIYPMTLGMDHSGDKFFRWPVDEGKDLTRGTNYQDASSIFAYNCDQDFFGSYNDDLDRGVVAYANHHQLPGKKAWTWGWGGYGTMHQADLTDADGPYNEVQTGPLLTQGEVGRLDPCEAVEWQEWWYPIHGMGGFTFANKDVAARAERNGSRLTLHLMGSAVWKDVSIGLWCPESSGSRPESRANLGPRGTSSLTFDLPPDLARADWFYVELRHAGHRLALFPVPLELPRREVPPKPSAPQTATELAQAGWQDFLFARYPEAEAHFRKALAADPKSVPAHTGLALLRLDADPRTAMAEAGKAIRTAPESGLAHFARAVAADRTSDWVTAVDEAWAASLDPATATPGRALVAKLKLRFGKDREAAQALAASGPWQSDPLARNRLAYACLRLGERDRAVALARENLVIDPLDTFARSLLWQARAEPAGFELRRLLRDDERALLELIAAYAQIVGDRWSPIDQLVRSFVLDDGIKHAPGPLPLYWALPPADRQAPRATDEAALRQAIAQKPAAGVFPYQPEMAPLLREALERNPADGKSALYLGHLLFHLGRHDEARALWRKAAELGTEPVIAYRALGMAARTLDNDLKSARSWLEKASLADPQDAIVARDLANVLFALADQAGADADKQALVTEARDKLQGAFEEGKGRSDFVALLARSLTRLGDPAATARLLDSVRITIWEGAREAHDLFEAAHLALGDQQLASGHAAEALAQFDRALEYPKNLATGKLENTREAHIQLRRGNALAALGRKDDARAAWRLAAEEPGTGDPKQDEARTKARAAIDAAGR